MLTDEEIYDIKKIFMGTMIHPKIHDFARAIESAVLAKASQQVQDEPHIWFDRNHERYECSVCHGSAREKNEINHLEECFLKSIPTPKQVQSNDDSVRKIGNELHNLATKIFYDDSGTLDYGDICDQLQSMAVRLWSFDTHSVKATPTPKQDPVYQAQTVGGLWLDVDKDTFEFHEIRRKLYRSPPQAAAIPVDTLAQIIREVDGNHKLGAGALAEKIVEKLSHNKELQNLRAAGMAEHVEIYDDSSEP